MINVDNLSKYFGSSHALGPVSFEIDEGECVGFLGLNGAGKTTALRILACDLRPSSGTVSVGDVDALEDPNEVRKRIGYLPENSPLYLDMSVVDYLRFAGRLRGLRGADLRKKLPAVLEITSLDEAQNELVRNLSHGYKQRVGVAQAIVHEPDLLILDEPTRGLDPVQIVEMRNMIQHLKQAHTVLISSHILTEISQTCDRLLVLGDGEIIAAGTEEALSADLIDTKRIEIVVRTGAQSASPYRSGLSSESDEERAAAEPASDEERAAAEPASDEERAAAEPASDEKSAEPKPSSDGSAQPIAALLETIDGVTEVTSMHSKGVVHTIEATCSEDIRPRVCKVLVEAGHDVLKIDEARSELESVFLKLVQGGQRARN